MKKIAKYGIVLLSVAVLGAAPLAQGMGVFAEENTAQQEQQVVYLKVYHSGYDKIDAWDTYHPLGVTQVPVRPGQTIYWNDIVSSFPGYTVGKGSVIIPYEAVADGTMAETSVPYYKNTPTPTPTPDPQPQPDPTPTPDPQPQPDPTPQPDQAITFTVTHNGYERPKAGIDGVGAFIETLLTEKVTVQPGGSVNIRREFPGYGSLEGEITYEQAKAGDYATNGYTAMYLKKAETPTPTPTPDPQPQPDPTPTPDPQPQPDPTPTPTPDPKDPKDNGNGNANQNGENQNGKQQQEKPAEKPADTQKSAEGGENGASTEQNSSGDKQDNKGKSNSEAKKEENENKLPNTGEAVSSLGFLGVGLLSSLGLTKKRYKGKHER